MEKYAFVILAHTDPEKLRRLVYALDNPAFDIYIHLDKKVNIDIFKFDTYHLSFSKMVVLEKRFDIYWGDISMVDATICAYQTAVKTDNYSRFVLLSGLDYPILSNKEIYEALSDKNKEYIIGKPICGKELHKVQCRYEFQRQYTTYFFRAIYKFLKIKYRKPYLKLNDGKKYPVYFAPQWCALSGDAIKMVLEKWENHPEIRKYFIHSYASDELVIPTLLFNSDFKEKTLCSDFSDDRHYNEQTSLHYLNYQKEIEVYTESKYDDIIRSGKLFFRKARTGVSDKLLDMIDDFRRE